MSSRKFSANKQFFFLLRDFEDSIRCRSMQIAPTATAILYIFHLLSHDNKISTIDLISLMYLSALILLHLKQLTSPCTNARGGSFTEFYKLYLHTLSNLIHIDIVQNFILGKRLFPSDEIPYLINTYRFIGQNITNLIGTETLFHDGEICENSPAK